MSQSTIINKKVKIHFTNSIGEDSVKIGVVSILTPSYIQLYGDNKYETILWDNVKSLVRL